ncbi:MAG: hypothetical protein ACRCR4_07390 [Thiotrichaceae bacterium]|jgi:hypothetical protein|uniref:WxL domain-containing protein n=1 Tax=Candidatus Thiocaldithrix dubininis TaxID=3080823 RepID=A0AA95H5M1_9GAMM|nr:MAG: hypothetical protein QJT80_14710 [Candidatus Thiocaldithrix dubininis]
MKFSMKLLAVALVSSAAALMHVAQAESTYGYNAAGTGTVSATAKAKVTVNIPKMILLRVGTAGTTVDELTFNGTPSIVTMPTGGLVDGNSQSASWDGNAPTFADVAGQTLSAFSWTNNLGGATLSCATVADQMFQTANGLTSTDVEVANGGANTLAHPGANTACSGSTSIPKNTLVSSTWTYSIKGTALAKAAAGTHKQTTTYTATTL